MGDAFLHELWPTFYSEKTNTGMNQVSKPFLFEKFDVKPYFTSAGSSTRSTLARILNEFTEALNKMKAIPKYIIFITGRNIVEAAKHGGPGGKLILEKCMNWLFSNINLALTTRKEI